MTSRLRSRRAPDVWRTGDESGRRLRSVLCAALLLTGGGNIALADGPQQLATFARVADGSALPFQSEAQLVTFLREAEVLENESVGIGIADAHRLVLEQDGVRLTAAFRSVDVTHTRVRLGDGSFYQKLRDFCGFEVAAYELSKLLGMDNIPITAHRRVDGQMGSVQLWVPDAIMEEERVAQGQKSPDPVRWRQYIQEMLLFDELIGNVDRNPGNMLIDADWKVWLIDHTRGFQQGAKVRALDRISWVRHSFWERLLALEPDAVPESIRHDLSPKELSDLFARRDLIVEHVEALIATRGAGAVLY